MASKESGVAVGPDAERAAEFIMDPEPRAPRPTWRTERAVERIKTASREEDDGDADRAVDLIKNAGRDRDDETGEAGGGRT